MKVLSKSCFLTPVIPCLFILLFINTAYGATYTTVADGNWNSAATWGGNVPPTDVPATDTINIRHTVFYDTGAPLKNNGTIRIQPTTGTTATLNVPTNINVENFAPSPGGFYVISGSFLQCRFVGCNNGQPYNGNNPQAVKQSGTFKNIGGFVEIRNSNIEVAQDWTSENNGTRIMVASCVTTGQNFSIKGSGSNDTLREMNISIGWHGSGSFELADGIASFIGVQLQLAGTSGNVKLDSGTASGDFDYIALRNHIAPFIGGGEIFASPSLSVNPSLILDEYCVSGSPQYKPNGKFSGTQTPNCSRDLSVDCTPSIPTAASASVEGRVTTAKGLGIINAAVELHGGSLEQPLRVRTGPSGKFIFEELPVGETYVVTVYARRHTFLNPSRVITLVDNVTGLDFRADGGSMFLSGLIKRGN